MIKNFIMAVFRESLTRVKAETETGSFPVSTPNVEKLGDQPVEVSTPPDIEIKNPNDVVIESPVAPIVAPDDAPVFDLETMEKFKEFQDSAVLAPDFETFSNLLVEVANRLGMNPAVDLPKIASVLNRFRVDAGKEPI